MKVIAKCNNYSGCVIAYRGDEIELDEAAPLVCPECGKPIAISVGGKSWMKTTAILSAAIIIVGGAAAYFALSMFKRKDQPKPAPLAQVATATSAAKTATPEPPRTTPKTIEEPKPVEPAPAPEPTPIIPTAKFDADPNSSENKTVKTEVLTRIDWMPNVTQGNKDKLYNSVERARTMGKVLTIQFGSGQSSIPGTDALALKAALEAPAVMKIRDDPTAVFVILGYADSKGDEKKNLAVSQVRADNVLNVMRDKCKIVNVMHSVAMGGSKLLDAENLEKNRIVEVWAVLP